jgi:hypothetical protein
LAAVIGNQDRLRGFMYQRHCVSRPGGWFWARALGGV